jgi:hypothetical protein
MRRLLGTALLGLVACGGGTGGFSEQEPGPSKENPEGTVPVGPGGEVNVEGSKAILEVVPLDIWSQPLPEEGTHLSITHEGKTASHPSTMRYGIRSEGTYQVSLSHPDHFDLELPLQDADSHRQRLPDRVGGSGHGGYGSERRLSQYDWGSGDSGHYAVEVDRHRP